MRLALELALVGIVVATFFHIIEPEEVSDVEIVMSDMPLTNVVTAARSVH
jgi:hypothetical protein